MEELIESHLAEAEPPKGAYQIVINLSRSISDFADRYPRLRSSSQATRSNLDTFARHPNPDFHTGAMTNLKAFRKLLRKPKGLRGGTETESFMSKRKQFDRLVKQFGKLSAKLTEATYRPTKLNRRPTSGGTIKIMKGKGGYWLGDKGPFARSSDALHALERLLKRRPKSIVLARNHSLGPSGTADPYSDAPYAIFGYRGNVVAAGFSALSLLTKHAEKFVFDPLPRNESELLAGCSLIEAVDRILSEESG